MSGRLKIREWTQWGIAILLLGGCSKPSQVATHQPTNSHPVSVSASPVNVTEIPETIPSSSPTTQPTTTAESSPASGIPPNPTIRPTLAPDEWMTLPVIPTVSETTRRIYQRGLELGNNPHAYSKVGDCESTPTWFLGDFDAGQKYYDLGEYTNLETVIVYYQGSHGRTSLAVKSGFKASSVFSKLWASSDECEANETPLSCEYRIHRPILAIITLGSNDVWQVEKFEPNMRKIIDFSIEKGIVPILATKADNREGDHAINTIIARLAWEYDIPLWNFWAAVQELPNQGLQEDGAHLTWSANFFNKTENLKRAWPIRNLTALQTLDSIWSAFPTPEH